MPRLFAYDPLAFRRWYDNNCAACAANASCRTHRDVLDSRFRDAAISEETARDLHGAERGEACKRWEETL